MKNSSEERLFTPKAVVAGAMLYTIYGLILFSLDRQWVVWAGSMLMGALYVPDPPPVLFASPREAFQMASILSLVSLFTLGVLTVLRGEEQLGWCSGLKARIRNIRLTGREKRATAGSPSVNGRNAQPGAPAAGEVPLIAPSR